MNLTKIKQKREEGFTIIELLIVIIVIAILAALVIAAYIGIQQRARDAERQSDIRNIITAVQAYATINDGEYPTCTEVANGTVENIDPEALEPPQDGSFTPDDAAAANSSDYGCVQTPLSPDDPTGLTFTYWSETEGAVIPRSAGEV